MFCFSLFEKVKYLIGSWEFNYEGYKEYFTFKGIEESSYSTAYSRDYVIKGKLEKIVYNTGENFLKNDIITIGIMYSFFYFQIMFCILFQLSLF